MNDQANLLRQLVRREAGQRPADVERARLVVVAAGKGGVGATTVAANLGIALSRAGHGCLLVDGNPHSADATTLCGLDAQFGISHVVAGWRSVPETLLDGPSGIQVLPGVWDRQYDDQWTELAQTRLIEELRALGSRESESSPGIRRTEMIVVDAGCGLGTTLGRWWRGADAVLMVTTPDSLAVMDAYAAIKVHAEGATAPIHVLANQAADTQQAADVHLRLARVCHRFLGLTTHDAGYLPILSHESRAATDGLFVLHAPESTAARYLDRLAQMITQQIAQLRTSTSIRTQRAGEGESTLGGTASLACASG